MEYHFAELWCGVHHGFRGQYGGNAAGSKPNVHFQFEAHRRATKFSERAGAPAGVYRYPCRARGATYRRPDKAARQCGFLLLPGLYYEDSIGRLYLGPRGKIDLTRFQDGRILFVLDFGDLTSRRC